MPRTHRPHAAAPVTALCALAPVLAATFVTALALVPAPAAAQETPVYLLGRVDPGGLLVDIDGETAAVRASDRVVVYQRDLDGPEAWGEVLSISRGVAGSDSFGSGLDLEGDRLAAGAPFSNEVLFNAGAAWIYERNEGGTDNWGEVKELAPADLVNFDTFGAPLALDGDRLLVGSRNDNYDNLNDPGSAYLFERDAGGAGNWGEVTKLVPSNAVANRHCGSSVALAGDYAALLCFGNEMLYLFERDAGGAGNWGEVAEIALAGTGVYGSSLVFLDDVLIVGATDDDEAAADAGAVYLLSRTPDPPAWGPPQKLMLDDAVGGELFGRVGATADWLLVGAPGESSVRPEGGAAYLFAPDPGEPIPWQRVNKFTSHDLAQSDGFGTTAVSGDLAAIGAPNARSSTGIRHGVVYFYCLDCPTILADGFESGDLRRWTGIVP